MHHVKCGEPGIAQTAGPCIDIPFECESKESSVMGGYLDVKVRIFQIQQLKPVPWAYLDLFQSDHPERPFHQGVIQESEI